MSLPSSEASKPRSASGLAAYLENGDYEVLHFTPIESYVTVCEEIAPADRPMVVAVDGPTNSGKTSFARTLAGFYTEAGASVSYLPLDSFLADRDTRNGIFRAVIEGDVSIADYSRAAWDHERYSACLIAARGILTGCLETQELVIPDAYNRQTGKKDQTQSIPVHSGGVLITEGVGLHAYHHELFDTNVRVDIQNDDDLLERVLQRERQKATEARLTDEYLRWRYNTVDGPHTAHLRRASIGVADFVIDTSNFTDMVVYRKQANREGTT